MSQADVERSARARPVDLRELHRAHHAIDAVVKPTGLLAVDLDPPHLAARTVDNDSDRRRTAAVLCQTTAELAAVARVHGEHLVHPERLGLVAVVAEIE